MLKNALNALVLSLALIPTISLADLWCSQSYRDESFAMGVANGVHGASARPKILDEMCFRLGEQYGQNLKRDENNSSGCESAFNEGTEEGLRGTMNSHSTDNFNCFQAGNQFGLARLSIAARARNINEVGEDCINAYARGKQDGLDARVATLPLDDKERACYLTGHNDANLFGGLL